MVSLVFLNRRMLHLLRFALVCNVEHIAADVHTEPDVTRLLQGLPAQTAPASNIENEARLPRLRSVHQFSSVRQIGRARFIEGNAVLDECFTSGDTPTRTKTINREYLLLRCTIHTHTNSDEMEFGMKWVFIGGSVVRGTILNTKTGRRVFFVFRVLKAAHALASAPPCPKVARD